MNLRRVRFKLGLIVLLSGGVIACACAALGVDVSRVMHDLLQSVGMRSAHAGRVPREIIIAAGDELTVTGNTQTITAVPPDEVTRRLAWAGMYAKDGWLNFRGQSLEMVASEFNRHNRRQLKIGDPRTGWLQVGGKFRVNDLDGFVAALGKTNGVRATLSAMGGRVGELITLSGGNSQPAAGAARLEGPTPEP